MPNSKQIVYLSQAQYAELIANGTITVDGVTVIYDENDIYVTPQAEPVTDVRVVGTSVAANGVADIPIAASNKYGVVRVLDDYGMKITSNNYLSVSPASTAYTKSGVNDARAIVPRYQHEATFYGLAKAAGHDEKDSSESVGTYTPEAKGVIQKMLGVSDLIATEENNLIASKAYAVGDIFTANGKLYKATAAIAVDGAIITDGVNANCEETNVGEGFVKKTDIATATKAGILRPAGGLTITEDRLYTFPAMGSAISNGTEMYKPITPRQQHEATFYGLAKAAGADEKDSTLPMGTYTDNAKVAIRTMLGATSSNVIAIQDTQPTDTDTKIWLPETAETPVEVPTVAEMEQALAGKVGFEDYATTSKAGIIKIGAGLALNSSNMLIVNTSGGENTKNGTSTSNPLVPAYQHYSAFYGLAKAAGDTTQAASSNAVGTYTDEAKQAIRTMLGAIGTEDYATASTAGIVRVHPQYGLTMVANDAITIQAATDAELKAGATGYKPISPHRQHIAAFYGLAKAAGDTTQSASSNAVGTYTDDAKLAIQTMLGIDLSSIASQVEIPLVETVTGTDVTINGQPNVRYNCGEVSTITINPPAAGSIDVIFTSGTSVAVLTLPSTVKMPEWFDATTLETDTIYEILITDGTYGSVMTWAV